MKFSRLFLAAACALCCQVAFAQTSPASAPNTSSRNMQSSSSTNTGTQTSSPTTTGMDNGSVSPPAQTSRRMAEDGRMGGSSASTMRKTHKMKSDGTTVKTKTKM